MLVPSEYMPLRYVNEILLQISSDCSSFFFFKTVIYVSYET
jgi:hypothetical protein